MRILWALPLCAAVAGCGIAQQRELEEKAAAAKAEMDAGVEICNQKYPKSAQPTILARAQCISAATLVAKPFDPYPDIFEQESTLRVALAEKAQKGQISVAEYESQYTTAHAQAVSERQRRALATRSVNAQESAATAQRVMAVSSVLQSLKPPPAPEPIIINQPTNQTLYCRSTGHGTAECN